MADDPNLDEFLGESEDALESFMEKTREAARAVRKAFRDFSDQEEHAKALKNQIDAMTEALKKEIESQDKSTRAGRAYAKTLSQELQKLQQMREQLDDSKNATREFADEVDRSGSKIDKAREKQKKFNDELSEFVTKVKQAYSVEGQLTTATDIASGSIGNLTKQFKQWRSAANNSVAGTALLTGASLYLGKAAGQLAEGIRGLVKDLNAYQVQLQATSKISLASPTGIQGLEDLRNTLGTTRAEFAPFLSTLQEASKVGIDTSALESAAQNVTNLFGEGSAAQAALKEYADILMRMPSLAQDMSFTATTDDRSAALFALAESGSVDVAIKAGLLGGIEGPSEEAGVQTEIQRSLRVQEDIRDEVRQVVDGLSPLLPGLEKIGGYTNLVTKTIAGGLIPAVSMFGSIAVSQRQAIIAGQAFSAGKLDKLPDSFGKGIMGRMKNAWKGAAKGGASLGGKMKAAGRASGLGGAGVGAAASLAAVGVSAALFGRQIYKTIAYYEENQKAINENSSNLSSMNAVVGTSTEKFKELAGAMQSGKGLEIQSAALESALGRVQGNVGVFDDMGVAVKELGGEMAATIGSAAALGASLGLLGGPLAPLTSTVGAAVGALSGLAIASYQLLSHTNDLSDAAQEAANNIYMRSLFIAVESGMGSVEEFSRVMKKSVKVNKEVDKVLEDQKSAALAYQQTLKSLDAASKSPIVRMYQFSAELGKSRMDLQRAIGGTTDAYLDSGSKVTKSFGNVLAKRAQDLGRIMSNSIKKMGDADPVALSMAFQKAEKIMADETKRYVSEFENVIQRLAETPNMIQTDLKRELAGTGVEITKVIGAGLSIDAAMNAFSMQVSLAGERMDESTKVFKNLPAMIADFEQGIKKARAETQQMAVDIAKGMNPEQQKEAAKALGGEKNLRAFQEGRFGDVKDKDKLLEAARAQEKSAAEQASMLNKAMSGIKRVSPTVTGMRQGLEDPEAKKNLQDRQEILSAAYEKMQLNQLEEQGRLTDPKQIKRQKELKQILDKAGGGWVTGGEEGVRERTHEEIYSGSNLSMEEVKKLLDQTNSELAEIDKYKQQTVSNLESFAEIDLSQVDFSGMSKANKKFVQDNFAMIQEVSKYMATTPDANLDQVMDKTKEVFKNQSPDKAMIKLKEIFVDQAKKVGREGSAAAKAVAMLERAMVAQQDPTIQAMKAIKESTTGFLKGLQQQMSSFNQMLQYEGDALKSAMLDVATIEAFNSSELGMPFQLFGEAYTTNMNALSATTENAAKVRANALRTADEIASKMEAFRSAAKGGKVDKGDAIKEIERRMASDKPEEKISKDLGKKLINSIELMTAEELNSGKIAEILKKTAIRTTLEKELAQWNKVISATFRDFGSTDIVKSMSIGMSSVDEMVEYARFGFDDLANQSANAFNMIQERAGAEEDYYNKQLEAAQKLRAQAQAGTAEALTKAKAAGKSPAEIEEMRAAIINRSLKEEMKITNKINTIEVRAFKERMKYAFLEVDLAQKRSEINQEIAQTQLGVLEQIGAPYATILEQQAKIVGEARKQADYEKQRLEWMQKNGADALATKEQELKAVKAQAKVAQASIQAQRSSMEKLLGATIGELGNIGGFKRNLLAQQRGTGLVVGPGGIVQGGPGEAKSKSEQAAMIQSASIIDATMDSKSTKEEPAKDLKTATEKQTDATTRQTDATIELTNAINNNFQSEHRKQGRRGAGGNVPSRTRTDIDTDAATGGAQARSANVNLPMGKPGTMAQRGMGGSGVPTRRVGRETPQGTNRDKREADRVVSSKSERDRVFDRVAQIDQEREASGEFATAKRLRTDAEKMLSSGNATQEEYESILRDAAEAEQQGESILGGEPVQQAQANLDEKKADLQKKEAAVTAAEKKQQETSVRASEAAEKWQNVSIGGGSREEVARAKEEYDTAAAENKAAIEERNVAYSERKKAQRSVGTAQGSLSAAQEAQEERVARVKREAGLEIELEKEQERLKNLKLEMPGEAAAEINARGRDKLTWNSRNAATLVASDAMGSARDAVLNQSKNRISYLKSQIGARDQRREAQKEFKSDVQSGKAFREQGPEAARAQQDAKTKAKMEVQERVKAEKGKSPKAPAEVIPPKKTADQLEKQDIVGKTFQSQAAAAEAERLDQQDGGEGGPKVDDTLALLLTNISEKLDLSLGYWAKWKEVFEEDLLIQRETRNSQKTSAAALTNIDNIGVKVLKLE